MKAKARIILHLFLLIIVSTIGYAQSQEIDTLLDRIRRNLPEDTAILIYSNVEQTSIIQLLLTRENISGTERSKAHFVRETMARYETDILTTLPGNENTQDEFSVIVEFYRSLLQQPTCAQTCMEIGNRLYELLFGNLQQQLQGKSKLLVIPDGILHFLPFEAIIDSQGKYLIETYHISYVQSLNVLELLQQRRYAQHRKPLLAFGGAVYNEASYEKDMHNAVLQWVRSSQQTLQEPPLLRGKLKSFSEATQWSNLPGTLYEVKALEEIVTGAEIVTGTDVNETTIKTLSTIGKLAEYAMLHFASYGIADSRNPDHRFTSLRFKTIKLLPGNF